MAKSPTPSVYNAFGPYMDVRSYGARGDGLTDDTAAIQACIDAMAASLSMDSNVPGYSWITTRNGGTVYFPRGWYKITSKLTLGNRVSLVGPAYTPSGIIAGSGFSDTVMVDCVDSTDPIFDSRIANIRLHANNDSNIAQVITAQAWQEHCGLFNCSIDGYQGEGILITDVSEGSAGFSIHHTTFGGFANNTAAIHVESTVQNAFVLNVNEVTINPSDTCTNGIDFENGRLLVNGLHVENCTNGIHMEGGNASINVLTGASTTANCLTIASGFAGIVDAWHIDPNGGTRAIDDNNTSQDITTYTPYFHYPCRYQFANTDATPSVTNASPVYRTFNQSSTTITDFDRAYPGQRFILRFQDGNTTIDCSSNANITRVDSAGVDISGATGDWCDIWDDGGVWFIVFHDATP